MFIGTGGFRRKKRSRVSWLEKTQGDQVLAESSAVQFLPFQGLFQLFCGNYSCLDEFFSQMINHLSLSVVP
jgi:hypothetical protein